MWTMTFRQRIRHLPGGDVDSNDKYIYGGMYSLVITKHAKHPDKIEEIITRMKRSGYVHISTTEG